ncbi:hypothetical protein Y032_0586g334 [Ancylostoma ceylanicum]|uniref:Serpentine receptor class gamma n=1 Tax=Ancylostoma ceylanicum TaxID=53326 RepID=A0A016WN25_9BILA|nr:hypothetical protein Y032_0586g334 [Ancylostoma ceylanicum]
MSTTQRSQVESVTQPSIPPQLFVGSDRTYAILWYCIICIVSLILHLVFILGIRKLCGWKSNFCFTLLLIVSVMCMVRFTTELIASLTASFYMDWNKYQTLWIVLGSFAFAPYFTVVILNIAITFHRLVYTAFPFTASEYLTKIVMQVILLVAALFFLAIVVILNTDLLGVRWVDSFMSWALMKGRNPSVFRLLNTLSNYGVGVINIVTYSLLFALLFKRKLISFMGNHEIKMTLQVLCMVFCEILFFLYWQFWNMEGYGPWDLVIAETSNLLYFDVIVIPYLVLNRSIHSQLRNLGKTKFTRVTRSDSRVNVHG